MLILTRREGNRIMIGEDIEVTIVDITKNEDGDSIVAVGIKAPKHICIDREEVRKRRIAKVDEIFNTDG